MLLTYFSFKMKISVILVGVIIAKTITFDSGSLACGPPYDRNNRLLPQAEQSKKDSVDTVSYTHLTLPTICSV